MILFYSDVCLRKSNLCSRKSSRSIHWKTGHCDEQGIENRRPHEPWNYIRAHDKRKSDCEGLFSVY